MADYDNDKEWISTEEMVEAAKSSNLQECAQVLHDLAEHARDEHKCISSFQILMAIHRRLMWFHDAAMKGADLLNPPMFVYTCRKCGHSKTVSTIGFKQEACNCGAWDWEGHPLAAGSGVVQ